MRSEGLPLALETKPRRTERRATAASQTLQALQSASLEASGVLDVRAQSSGKRCLAQPPDRTAGEGSHPKRLPRRSQSGSKLRELRAPAWSTPKTKTGQGAEVRQKNCNSDPPPCTLPRPAKDTPHANDHSITPGTTTVQPG